MKNAVIFVLTHFDWYASPTQMYTLTRLSYVFPKTEPTLSTFSRTFWEFCKLICWEQNESKKKFNYKFFCTEFFLHD